MVRAEEVGLEPTGPLRGTAFQAVVMAAIRLLQELNYFTTNFR